MNNNYHFRKLVEIDAIHNIYISNLDEGKKLMDLVGVGSAQKMLDITGAGVRTQYADALCEACF